MTLTEEIRLPLWAVSAVVATIGIAAGVGGWSVSTLITIETSLAKVSVSQIDVSTQVDRLALMTTQNSTQLVELKTRMDYLRDRQIDDNASKRR